jgi:hypothetical protein
MYTMSYSNCSKHSARVYVHRKQINKVNTYSSLHATRSASAAARPARAVASSVRAVSSSLNKYCCIHRHNSSKRQCASVSGVHCVREAPLIHRCSACVCYYWLMLLLRPYKWSAVVTASERVDYEVYHCVAVSSSISSHQRTLKLTVRCKCND